MTSRADIEAHLNGDCWNGCALCELEDDQPCDRCAFIPTPDGKCICREVAK